MKFLVDESLSTRVAQQLREHAHDAIHAADRDLLGAADTAVMQTAAAEGGVVISVDTDSANCWPSGDTLAPA